MIKDINLKYFNERTKPGISAHLLNKKAKELVQYFIVEGDEHTVHVLNAVSPAFTCSFPFAKWIVDNYIYEEDTINRRSWLCRQ